MHAERLFIAIVTIAGVHNLLSTSTVMYDHGLLGSWGVEIVVGME